MKKVCTAGRYVVDTYCCVQEQSQPVATARFWCKTSDFSRLSKD